MSSAAHRHAEQVARLEALDRALGEHARWMARLNRQLICGGAPAPDDLAPDGHLRSAFGRWLHGEARDRLGHLPGYAAIIATHEALHGIGRHLLASKQAAQPIADHDYDALLAVAARLRLMLRQMEQQLMEQIGALDKLTGVWNRQAVHLRLAEEVERMQRSRQPCALCHAGLDRPAGDQLIQAVAGFFKARLRGYDTLYRLTGEDFLLCLPNTDLNQAAHLINRMREELAAARFELAGQAVALTASFGVVALDPVFFIDELLAQAERAQLIARGEGGNGVCIWREGDAA